MCGPRAVLFLLLTGLTMCSVSNEKQSSDDELKKLYQSGVDAYLENNFSGCVGRLETSLEKYREYRQKIVACRQMCAMDAELFEPFYPVDVENLRFYEKTLRGTLCLIKCRNGDELLSRTATISPDTEKIFEHRKPYQYLHLCYFQTNNSQKAASSAYTYLAAFPTDEDVKNSLKHYTTLPQVKSDAIENYEIQNFVYLYSYGANAYDQKDWETAVNNMEESLIQVIQAEDECRFQCEGPFNQEWRLDFIPSIANHFTHVLRCKMGCMDKLSRINGDVYEDLLPSHYDYLQFAYYKMGKLREACRAVASHLLFYPNDVKMKNNMEYYIKLPKVDEGYFSPRPEAVHYMNRNRYERHIINFVDKEFQLENLMKATESEKDSKVVLVPLEKNDEGEGLRKKIEHNLL